MGGSAGGAAPADGAGEEAATDATAGVDPEGPDAAMPALGAPDTDGATSRWAAVRAGLPGRGLLVGSARAAAGGAEGSPSVVGALGGPANQTPSASSMAPSPAATASFR